MSHFDAKAKDWDSGKTRVDGTLAIARAIEKRHHFHNEMEVLDFGVGTGLLGFEIAKRVKKVCGVDTSKEMLEQVKSKNTSECSIEPLLQDILKEPLKRSFDAVVSSMTLHHIEELELFFKTICQNIKEGGFIAIADLEKEDGTFHSDNTGVFHFGFERDALVELVSRCGFGDVVCETINTIEKPARGYDIFLLTAKKL